MSFTLAPPHGVFQIRCADSTHSGQGHKRVFGRWHALCFLATHRFSSRASSRTNTSHRHGLNRLGAAYENSHSGHHHLKDTLFRNQLIRPSHALFCRVSSQIGTSRLRLSLSRMPLISKMITHHRLPLFTPLGAHRHSLYVLGFISSFNRLSRTCILSLSRRFHYPENNCERMSAFVGTRHH